MGSGGHARGARKRGGDMRLMISLEMLGAYSDAPGSQRYPPLLGWVYPDRANFIVIVSNIESRHELKPAVATFRWASAFPAESLAAPAFVPGASWSDHLSFWREGYPAIMVTDTAFNRYPHYHSAHDTPPMLDYARMAQVVEGRAKALVLLANAAEVPWPIRRATGWLAQSAARAAPPPQEADEEQQQDEQHQGQQRLWPQQMAKLGSLQDVMNDAAVEESLEAEADRGGSQESTDRQTQHAGAIIEHGMGEGRHQAEGAQGQEIALTHQEAPGAMSAQAHLLGVRQSPCEPVCRQRTARASRSQDQCGGKRSVERRDHPQQGGTRQRKHEQHRL